MSEPTTAAGRALFEDGDADVDIDAILAIEAEARAEGAAEVARRLSDVVAFLDRYGLANTSGERHVARRTALDKARIALDADWSGQSGMPPGVLSALYATPEPAPAPLDALPTVEAMAKAMVRVRGAHNGPDDLPGNSPCDWCQLAARQALEAARLATDAPGGAG